LWRAYDLDMLQCSKPPKDIYQNISRGPQGYPGGPNGPAAVLQGTRGGATWKYAVSQNPAVVGQIFDRTPYSEGVKSTSSEMVLQPPPPPLWQPLDAIMAARMRDAIMAARIQLRFQQPWTSLVWLPGWEGGQSSSTPLGWSGIPLDERWLRSRPTPISTALDAIMAARMRGREKPLDTPGLEWYPPR
jgi:hypothetical protein